MSKLTAKWIADTAIESQHLAASAKQSVLESKLIGARRGVINFTTSAASSDTVTTQVEAAAVVDTPRTDLTTGEGIYTGTVSNATDVKKVLIRQTGTDQGIDDGSGDEVFAKLTESTGTFTLSYFKADNTAYTFGSGTAIDFYFVEVQDYHSLKEDALLFGGVSGVINADQTTVVNEIDANVDDLITLSGVAENSTDLGTFTGVTISDTNTVKGALQELETAVELRATTSTVNEIDANVDDLITLSGVAENSTDLGTFTGTTIADSVTIKVALQSLETAVETKADSSTVTEIDGNVDDLITLSGVAENSTNLGTFTGTTISDSVTIKAALQELETAHESASSSISGHLDGGANKHDATEIDYELADASKCSIQDNSDTVELALQDLDSEKLSVISAQLVATSNITLSGEQTIDGTLTSTSVVAVVGQSTASQNGVYNTAAGAWSRIDQLSKSGQFKVGLLISVREGTANADTLWMNQAAVATVDTTAVDFDQIRDGSLAATVTEIDGNVDDLITLSGVAENSTDLGTFTGTTIADSVTIKVALQSLETAVETKADSSTVTEIDGNVDDLITLSGVAENSTNLGTFTGATISDANTVKGALQELETAVELRATTATVNEIDANVDDLITLSGVAENSTNLGTFTGTTIADSVTIKVALQSLETAVETNLAQLDALESFVGQSNNTDSTPTYSSTNFASGSLEAAIGAIDAAFGGDLSFVPTNYANPSDTVQAHLQAIDTALASAGSSEFADNVFRITDDGDSSKKIAFQASGISTSTVRTITMPDRDVDLDNVGVWQTESFTLNGTDITNKYVDLTGIPKDASAVQVFPVGGPPQNDGVDFDLITDGSDIKRLSWSALGMDGVLAAADVLRVHYEVAG